MAKRSGAMAQDVPRWAPMTARHVAFWIHRSSGALAAAAVALGASTLPVAFQGRQRVAELAERIPWLAPGLALWLTLALVAHVSAGIVLIAASAGGAQKLAKAPPREAELARLQRLSGWVATAFLVFHLGHAWQFGAALPIEAYATLRSDLGRIPYLLAYCAGATALALHLGQSASFASERDPRAEPSRARPTERGRRSRVIHLAAWVGSSILWLFLIAGLSFFASGTAAFWSL